MDYATDLSMEEIDQKLKDLGYNPEKTFAGCIYKMGDFTVEITVDGGRYIINHPMNVNGFPHPLRAHMLEFASIRK